MLLISKTISRFRGRSTGLYTFSQNPGQLPTNGFQPGGSTSYAATTGQKSLLAGLFFDRSYHVSNATLNDYRGGVPGKN